MTAPHLFVEAYGEPALKRLASIIKDAKSGDALAPVTVVAPTQYAGLSLRRSLGANAGIVNVTFRIPARVAEDLGAPSLASQGKAPLSRMTEMAAIRAIAAEVADGSPLAGVANHPNLHSSLRQAFADLSKLPDERLTALERADDLRAQIVWWYRRAKGQLRDYYDREELARTAARAVDRGAVNSILRDLGFIVFHLVHDLTPGEVELVNALGRAERCAVVLGFTGDADADGLTERLLSRLEATLGQAHRTTDAFGVPSVSHLVSAPDAQEEIRWVIRHMVRKAKEGTPFHRMAVFYRQRAPYATLIPGQLSLADVPVAGPDAAQLRDSVAGRLLLGLLEIIRDEFSRDAVMRWIAEAPIRIGDGDALASEELSRWEIISRKAGVVSGVGQWRERITAYTEQLVVQISSYEDLEESTPAQLEGMRDLVRSASRLLEFVKSLSESCELPAQNTWEAYADWAKNLLCHYAHDPSQWSVEHKAAYDRVEAILNDLAGLDMVTGGANLTEFVLALDDALSAPSGRIGKTGEGVFVAPVGTAQAMEFDIVYVVGLAEGAFPPRVRDDPMLPDEIRQSVSTEEWLPTRLIRRARERQLYLAALNSAPERVLCYPRADSAGQREQYPSLWLLDAATTLNGEPVSSDELTLLSSESWLTVIESVQHGLDFASDVAAADEHDYDLASLARWHAHGLRLDSHFLANGQSTLSRSLDMEKARNSRDFTAWDGKLSELSQSSRKLALPLNGIVSPTRLERWAICPYRYFLGDVLGLSALESPEELMAISPLDKGSLIHSILEHFVDSAKQRGDLPDFGAAWNEGHLRMLIAIAQREFDRAERRGITGRRVLWEAMKQEILYDLEAFLQMDSQWRNEQSSRPMAVEQRFGFDGDDSLPPVVVMLSDGTQLLFRGLIDRVDEVASGIDVEVIDYKSGGTYTYRDMSKDPLGRGRHLQLPVYSLAMRTSHPDTDDVQGHYWFVTTRGGFQRKSVSLSEVEDRFIEVVETIATGIRAGVFPANPGERGQFGPENCTYCDFKRVCPANKEMLWRRKRSSPELERYVQLAGAQDDNDNEGEQ